MRDEAADARQPAEASGHEPAAEQSIIGPEQDIEPEQDVEEEEEWEEEDDEDDDSLPSFEFRVETAKLLIELDEHNNAATQVHLLPLIELLVAVHENLPSDKLRVELRRR